MDGSDPWVSRLSSSSSVRRHQLRSEAYLGGDDFDVDDEYKQEFSCPFCAEEFDIVGLYIHIEEEHQVELKQGICPVCAKRVGMDMVSHITMQHGNILKVPASGFPYTTEAGLIPESGGVIQRKRRLRKGIPNSMFNILRKELRDGNRQSLFGGSSFMLSSSNPDTDPLLSSFIYSSSSAEVGKEAPPPPEKETLLPEPVAESNLEGAQHSSLSKEDHEEKSKKCAFVRGLLLSTIFDDDL